MKKPWRSSRAIIPEIDREAAIFHALALIGISQPTDKTYANQKKAAAILNRILPEEPEHPGVAHYLIHSFDYPELAELALPAARVYAHVGLEPRGRSSFPLRRKP